MADNDSTLILSGKETVSVAVKAAIDSLEKYTVAVGEVTAADKKFLSSGAAVTAQLNGQAAAASKAATAVKSSSTVAISAAGKQTSAYQAYTAALDEAAAAQKRLDALQLSSRAESAVAISPAGVAASTVRPAATVTGLAATNAIGGTSAINAADAAEADRYAVALNEVAAAQIKTSTAGFELYGVQSTLNESMAAGSGFADAEGFSFLALTENSTAARHALEATSRATATLGIGLLAIPILTAVVAKDFQADFATVSRALVGGATTKQLAAIKDQLLTLSETTPTSFKNLTAIASAGAQMGISAKDIIAFTKTVAELTITTTVSAASAESFIRKFQLIDGVGASSFANLTSALLNVGIHTGATEAQIAILATQIIGIAKVAGLTTSQIIGLAAAFASINSTGPSRARGTIVRAFTDIQTAVEGGTPALTEFAKTAGVSAEVVTASFGTSKFANIFVDFLHGLNSIQQSGGDARKVLTDLGITSTVDVPLLLNAAGAYKLFGTALADASAGYNDAGILALHYNVIQKTVASQLTDLKNTFGVLANSIGTAAIPALTNVAKILEDVGKNLAAFSETAGGGVTLNAFAWIAVVGGSLLLLISVLAKVAASVLAVGKAYTFIAKTVVAVQGAMAATAGEATTLGAVMDFAFGPVGITIAAVAAAVAGLGIVLSSLRAPDSSISTALLSTTGSYKQLIATVTQGDSSKDLLVTALGGTSTTSAFANLDKALNTSTGIWKNYWGTLGNTTLVDANTSFINDTTKIGTLLANLSSTDLPGAQQGFDQFAKKTNGSQLELSRLLEVMKPYKSAIDQMLTANGQATTSQNEIALATGAATDKIKAIQDAIKAATDANANFSTELNTDLGGIGTAAITKLTTAYTKSLAPLTDFSTAVQDVQTAQSAALPSGASLAQQTAASAVSLSSLTAQFTANGVQAQQWATNLIIVAQKYGQGAANQFIAAGFSAVNQSILQQLANAAPAQGAAYEASQNAALKLASASAGQVLIDAGGLVVAGGGKIGADTAAKIGAQLIAGFSPAQIMAEFNLSFASNPAKPKADTGDAQRTINLFERANQNIKLNSGLSLDPGPAQRDINNFVASNNNRVINLRVVAATPTGILPTPSGHYAGGYIQGNGRAGYAGGGYTGFGGKYQAAGVVHKGEFVFTKEATDSWGVRNLYRMMNMSRTAAQAPHRGYASGGAVSGQNGSSSGVTLDLSAILGGNLTVSLSQTDRMLLAQNGNVQLYLDGQLLTAANNRNNVAASTRGVGA